MGCNVVLVIFCTISTHCVCCTIMKGCIVCMVVCKIRVIVARMRDHGLSDLKEGVTSLTSSFTLKVIAIATMM